MMSNQTEKKYVLFTPIGGTDPMSNSNFRDGSFIHICRMYRPSKVYMYMSAEMLEFQKSDDRYRFCLNALQEKDGWNAEVTQIERDTLVEVQDFNFFYEDFRGIIKKIYEELGDDEELIFNISSGTPAMKSGLLVLATIGEFPCKLVQVATPTKSINNHIHDNYDVVTLWELNEDNSDNVENRCAEVSCPNLTIIKSEEILKKHLLAYDYSAAYALVCDMPDEAVRNYKHLVEMAYHRGMLQYSKALDIAKSEGMKCFPIRSSESIKDYEYMLWVKKKQEKQEYVDLVRAITPIVVDLYENIIKTRLNIPIDKYITQSYNGVDIWDKNALQGSVIEKILAESFPQPFRQGPISSRHLAAIIKYNTKDKSLLSIVDNITNAENHARNMAAHEIVGLTDEKIKKLCGLTSKQIVDCLLDLFKYTNFNIKTENWNAYDVMNQEIIERM